MPRQARLIIPEMPHHVIQRGNRNQRVFFSDQDKRDYLYLLKEQGREHGLKFWAYCLMDNHVHFIIVPPSKEALQKALGYVHFRYTLMINKRENWKGHFWQGRFRSTPMDEPYLYAAVKYVERNPVRAKMVSRAEDYPWSSAKPHVLGYPDRLCVPFFLQDHIKDWSAFLAEDNTEDELKRLRKPKRGQSLFREK
jgi:putative transposase